jgi:hypothetical protein
MKTRRAAAASFVALAALAALAPATRAQSKNAAPVRIDFRALTESGDQVADLKPEELQLKVNGKPRQIVSLNLFRATAVAPSSSAQLPPPYATNSVGMNGRNIHILIDDDSIAPGRESQVREAVRLIASELGPGDRLGVLTPQGQLNMRPGADSTKVRLAVDGLAGRAAPTETEQDAQCRTLHVLRAVGTMLAMTGGAPTTIVVFSGGMSPPTVKQVAIGSPNRNQATNDMCPVTPDEFQNIGALASTAHADLYLFHLTEAMVNRSASQDAGFESLAGVMGAEFVRLTASPQAPISRMLRETGAYYVATFQPDPGERNGETLRVELKSTRDKLKLRTRPSVEIPKEVARANVTPKDMLRVAGERRDLPLRAAAYTSRIAGSDEIMVVALFEGIEPTATLTAASVGLFDEKNTLKKQWTAQSGDLAKRPVVAALSAPEGFYRLRVAAVDGGGRAGTADYEMKVEVPRADPLKMSALIIGTQTGTGFAPRLEFTNETVAIGLVEVYNVPKGSNVTVSLDVLQNAEGTPLASAETTVSPGKTEDARQAFGGFSIASLAPGDYQMRAIVSLDGKPVGRVSRTLRKAQ